ncbi:MAG TPA: barstar family protein [Planctomycetota bacterium]|nr:barstar family protein [Planctomycetota bacterium]
MPNPLVVIDCRAITNRETFHDVFTRALGFPDFYGRNMDAWNDCMTYLDDPEAGMSAVHVPRGGFLTLQLDHVQDFKKRCPELYTDVIECSAFVNWRRMEQGHEAILVLSFHS